MLGNHRCVCVVCDMCVCECVCVCNVLCMQLARKNGLTPHPTSHIHPSPLSLLPPNTQPYPPPTLSQVRIATVGAGTSRVLLEDPDAPLLTPVFEPTKANAVHLSAELPEIEGGCKEVLYPASVKAGSDLQVCVCVCFWGGMVVCVFVCACREGCEREGMGWKRVLGVARLTTMSKGCVWFCHIRCALIPCRPLER